MTIALLIAVIAVYIAVAVAALAVLGYDRAHDKDQRNCPSS